MPEAVFQNKSISADDANTLSILQHRYISHSQHVTWNFRGRNGEENIDRNLDFTYLRDNVVETHFKYIISTNDTMCVDATRMCLQYVPEIRDS